MPTFFSICCRGCATRRQDVVDDEDALAPGDGVLVDFERILAVFEIVGLLDCFRGKFSRLADGNESRTKPLGDGRAQDETAAFDSHDGVDALIHVGRRQQRNRGFEADRITQQRGDVVEKNAGLRKVRNVANVLFEVHQLIGVPSSLTFDREGSVAADFLIVHVHLLDARASRSRSDCPLDIRHGFGLALDDRLNTAIRQVPDPPHRAFATRRVLREPAEADALDAPADDKSPRNLHVGSCQL
jgi:hypothetical protein